VNVAARAARLNISRQAVIKTLLATALRAEQGNKPSFLS
jgi:hypothetical protein